jgi:ribose transport system permease protein
VTSTHMTTSRVRGIVRTLITHSETGVIGATVLITLAFFLGQPAFLSESSVRSILTAVSYLGIIAVGQTILLVCGEFDLSVGSVAGLSAIIAADAVTRFEVPVPLGLVLGVAVGGALGLINGLVVVRLRIPAFIQTLGMLFIASGLTQVITNGAPIYPLPEEVTNFGQASVIAGLGWSFVVFLVMVIIGDAFLRFTVPGRNCYAVGGNEQVARLVGINVGRYKILAFVTTGALSACAGIFVMANLGSATTAIGSGWELLVIAGVVVGGVSLFGGVGTVVAGVIGILLLQIVQSGLVVVGVSPNWQTVAVGLIMVIAVGLDVARRRLVISETTQSSSAVSPPEGRALLKPGSSKSTHIRADETVGGTPTITKKEGY